MGNSNKMTISFIKELILIIAFWKIEENFNYYISNLIYKKIISSQLLNKNDEVKK